MINMISHLTFQKTISICFTVCVTFRKHAASTPYKTNILFLQEPNNTSHELDENQSSDMENYTIQTEGCTIPDVEIDDYQWMKKFFHRPKILTSLCRSSHERLLANNQTHIWTIQDNFQYYNIENKIDLQCCYKSFHRPITSSGMSRKYLDNRITYLDCVLFNEIIEVHNEFVKVTCIHNATIVYNQFFVFTPKKPFTSHRHNPFSTSTTQAAYNIIIMGLGSVSRLNFHRTMPYTAQLLKSYGAVDLRGYNTVAGDTFQNMIPALVGLTNLELNSTCWPNALTTFDGCPFIWERFKDVGYYTAYLEDAAKFGMFNRNKFGFRGSPTDYYLRPFINEAETFYHSSNDTSFEPPTRNTLSLCMGDKYYFNVLLDYVESLTHTLKNSRLFGLFWETSMSRVDLNYPMRMDHDYAKLIRKFNESGYLNDTILILLSDHGMSTRDILLTKRGRLEQRLPFMYFLVPPSFRQNYSLAYNNLKANSRQLTTPFDLHNTLIDLVDLDAISTNGILNRSRDFYAHDRGISLFLSIPRNRTCEMAGIYNYWCTCYKYYKMPTTSSIIGRAVDFLTRYLNNFITFHQDCLELDLDEVIEAKEMSPSYAKDLEWREFTVLVRMAPGGGMFQAVLRYHEGIWAVVGTVKRLNPSATQSRCVEALLKPYCYCKY